MRAYWIIGALVSVAACTVGVQACSSALPPAQTDVGVPPPGVLTPLPLPVPLPEPLVPLPLPAPELPDATVLSSFEPLLALPTLRRAAEAYAVEDYATAATVVDGHMQRTTFDVLEEPRWHLMLGTLREKAGDLAGASREYARAAEGAWPLVDYAALGLGRALLGLGELERAELELQRVPESSAAVASARALLAELCCLRGDAASCLGHLQKFVAGPRKPGGWAAQAFRVGEMLVKLLGTPRTQTAAIENQVATLDLLRSLVNLAPNSADRFDVPKLEQTLLDVLPEPRRTEKRSSSPKERFERAEAMENAGRHEDADAIAGALLSELGDSAFGPIACQTRLLQGKALSERKLRQRATDRFAEVVQHCKAEELRAPALYLGGKVAFSDGRYPEAERFLAQLERELPRHRLADDARLYRAQAQREMGVEARFSELLDSMPDDYPEGDMTLDGVFLLALSRMEKGDWSGALTVLGRAVHLAGGVDARRGQESSGRERYFEARALIETGEVERGLAQYEALVSELPLSYYMLHAYSRLAERDPARAESTLGAVLSRALGSGFRIEHCPEFDQPGFLRMVELLRQGDIDAARRELELLDILRAGHSPSVSWGVATLFARAGSARHSHALPRWQMFDWLERWPAGPWKQAWEIAFPRPHIAAVTLEAKRMGIEPELVYAVMREESAFDAAAVSPANAYGLMQIISPTARRFGKEAGLPYDRRALTTPAVSIAIGSRVLASYRGHFPEDPLLAIPGYNAGPGRPRRWAKDWPSVDFDVWVELIPYRETRRYTKRVLASRATYAFLYYQSGDADALRLPRRLSPSSAN